MDLRLFDKYIALCKEFNSEPSFQGLNYFKKAIKR